MSEPPGTRTTASDPAAIAHLHERHGDGLVRAIRRVAGTLEALAAVTLVLLLAWTVGDILSRTLFGRPFPGTVELTELAVVVLVYLGLARAETQDAHISVDLLFVRLGERGRLLLRAGAGTLTFGTVVLLVWRLWVFSGDLATGGYTTGVLRIPLYPVALVGVVGAAVFGLAALANVLGSVRALVRSR
jgi:TRAP-type C4-dicarboxylate transport system permease small subunit